MLRVLLTLEGSQRRLTPPKGFLKDNFTDSLDFTSNNNILFFNAECCLQDKSLAPIETASFFFFC